MTEANLDHQPSWPSYQSHEQVYCLYCSARSVHNFRKKQLYTPLPSSTRYVPNSRKRQLYLGSAGRWVLPSLVTECIEVCT